MISKHKKLLLLLALISVLIAIPLAKVNAAATITVNSTADNQSNDGACTLREAIVASNTDTASGAAVGECVAGSGAGDLIEFDISGSGLKTIHITSGLPSITRTVTIDGYTQTDASVNTADFPDAMNGTLTVEIDAEGESGIYGIDISGSQADGTVIKGLIVNDIPYETFYLTDVDNVSIEGNYIGTSSTGNTADGGNSHGIRIGGSSTGNMIGGATAAKRNVISGNGNTGVLFYGSAQTTGNFVQGNYIGIGANGSSDVGNTQVGVASMEGPVANTIGGDGAGEGNVISGNGGVGITFISNSGGSNIIQGNYIGVGGDGSTAVPNGASGILIENGSDSNTVGGSSSGARNIISGNVEAGIFISGPTADSNTVVGNYIGTDNTGAVDVGNGLYGVVLDNSPSNIVGGTTGVTVGGDCTGSCNLISSNGTDGIWLYGDSADNNVIKGNHIGTNVAGTGDLGNVERGVNISASADANLVGGTTSSSANLIRFNDVRGVSVPNSGSINNAIIGNSLFQNAIPNIDLGDDGVTANDADDADSGPNDLLNFPEWSSYTESAGNTSVEYTLDVPAGDYRVETFSDNGKTLIDTQNITHTGSGSESFSNTITGDGYSAVRMTVTEIDGGLSSGFGSTSEYSAAYSDGTETITVNSIDDDQANDGECTLREAITAANDDTESGSADGECIAGSTEDTIVFDIAGSGVHTIQPTGAGLPAITDSQTTIDGYSQTGAVENSGDYSTCFEGAIKIEIDGSLADDNSAGITIAADNTTIRGLAINRFAGSNGNGIDVNSGNDNVIAGNILGLDTAGLADQGNGDAGVAINDTAGDSTVGGSNPEDRNIISGNDGNGGLSIYSDFGTQTVKGNCIGPDATGDSGVANANNGINLWHAATSIDIGGTSAGDKNVISGNEVDGVYVGEDSTIENLYGNYIGTNASGSADLGNNAVGIYVDNAGSMSNLGGYN